MTELEIAFFGALSLSAIIAALTAVVLDNRRKDLACYEDCAACQRQSSMRSCYRHPYRRDALDENIDSEQLNQGIRDLVVRAFQEDPDFIVGLNRGGVLVGAYLALTMGVPSNRFLRCCVTFDDDKENVECDFPELYGNVFVVDSMIRSGRTMSCAVKVIKEKYSGITTIFAAAIVTYTNADGSPKYKDLNYYYYFTHKKNLLFPWSTSEYVAEVPERYRHIRKDFDDVRKRKLITLANAVYQTIDGEVRPIRTPSRPHTSRVLQ